MKRILAAVIAAFMVASMSGTALATGGNSATGVGIGKESIDVTASYKPSGSVGTVYNVDIKWDSMKFTYTESSGQVWDPSTHTYSGSSSGKWDKTTADITVTNHSDSAVDVAITYTPTGDTGITGTITNGTATLQAGKIGKPNEADSMTATLKISGTPNSSVTEDGVKIGTITVKIS